MADHIYFTTTTAIPPLIRYQQSFQSLYSWFPIMLYGFLGALSSYLMAYHNMDVISDRFRATYGDTQDVFDFIVVGAGSSGAVLANRLSQDFNVLLLEAGGEPNPWTVVPGIAFMMLSYPEIDWLHKTVPQKKACFALPNQQSGWSQGKGLGGTSNLNFLIYLRGHEQDYDYWGNITGDSQWSFNELLPYFKMAEDYNGEWNDPRYHGQGGEMHLQIPPYRGMADIFVQAAQEKGYTKTDLNAPFGDEGFSQIYMPLRNGRRGGTFQSFIEPIRNRPSLTIYKFATVNKVLFRGPNNEAYAVQYERHGVIKNAYAKKEIILSAGAIQSPKILMHSGIGPRRHLESLGIRVRRDLPVGQNLQDHISTFLGPFFVNDSISMIIDRDVTAKSFVDFTRTGTGPLTTTGVQATGFLTSSYAKNTKGEEKWPDLQLIFLGSGVYKQMPAHFAHAFHVKPEVMTKYLEHAIGKDSFHVVVSLARPSSRGLIELIDSNPKSPLLIDPKYLDYKKDVQILIEGIKQAINISTNSPTMKKYNTEFTKVPFPGCEQFLIGTDEYWECYLRQYSITLHHIVGTAAMGKADSKDAVVDTELRVIGTKRLRVIDASVMIKVPIGNTHAPCVMIGEKGAALIKKTWKYSYDEENNSIIR